MTEKPSQTLSTVLDERGFAKRIQTRRCAMSLKQYYRPDEVMSILAISKATFYRMVNRIENPLPSIKLASNGHLRVPIDEFETWKKHNRVDPLGLNCNE